MFSFSDFLLIWFNLVWNFNFKFNVNHISPSALCIQALSGTLDSLLWRMVANTRYRSSVQFDKFWHMYTPKKSPLQSRAGLRECKILNRADPLRAEPLFPIASQLLQTQASLGFKVIYSSCSFSRSRNPRLNNLIWGSEPLLLQETLCNRNYPSFASHLS